MEIEPAPPRPRGGEAVETLHREDLDLYAVEELEERIELLRAEVARVRAKLDGKRSGRAAADALFSFGQSSSDRAG